MNLINSRFQSFKSKLKRLTLRDVLKLEEPIANNVTLPREYAEYKNADDLLVSQITSLVKVYISLIGESTTLILLG